MITCPYCKSQNIDGTDDCVECGQPLVDSHLAPPRSEVERTLLGDRIEVLAPKKPITVSPDDRVGDVLKLMAAHGIGCVVAVEGDKPVGIFSERDALRKINSSAKSVAGLPIREFMTPNPQTLVADAKIAFAVERMDLGGYRHLPIVDAGGVLIGIISARDILRHLTERLAGK